MAQLVIFDLDGVICDTMLLHNSIERDLLIRHGVDISTDTLRDEYAGIPFEVTLSKMLEGKNANIPVLIKEKNERLLAGAKGNITPIPGALELINALHVAGVKLALGSGSTREFVDLALSELGILDKFLITETADDVRKGKPDPEVFLKSEEFVGVPVEQCVVIEDGRSGMIAAKRAGMQCIGLVRDTSLNYPADVLVTSLEHVSVEQIKNM